MVVRESLVAAPIGLPKLVLEAQTKKHAQPRPQTQVRSSAAQKLFSIGGMTPVHRRPLEGAGQKWHPLPCQLLIGKAALSSTQWLVSLN
jgi:hypothetical protein